MLKNLFLLLFILICTNLRATYLEEAWEALENNNRAGARTLLNEAIEKNENKTEATILLVLLNTLEEKKENFDLFQEVYHDIENPDPYLFSLWFDHAITDKYSKKDSERLKFLEKIASDQRLNSAIRSSAHYILSFHYVNAFKMKEANKHWQQCGSIKGWQFVGPFDNSSGSGFDKPYKPILEPKPDAKFISKNHAEIQWITPSHPQPDPWVSPIYHLSGNPAIVYTQTFVHSPEEQEVIFALGFTGNLKVWLNDQLVMAEEQELRTDMDIFKRKARLHKGENRILIQMGFTAESSYPNFMLRLLDASGEVIPGLSGSTEYKPYSKGKPSDIGEEIPHFADGFFKQKIEAEPKNLLNYLLLSKVYFRSKWHNQAIDILKKAEAIAPKNMIIQNELLLNYKELSDRTQLFKQLENMRRLDGDLLLFATYDFEQNLKSEKLTEAEENLAQIEKFVKKGTETYVEYYIKLLAHKQEYQQLIELIDFAYQKYPENITFLELKFLLMKNLQKSSDQAVGVLEKYLNSNYNASISNMLLEEYEKTGNKSKLEKRLIKLREAFPEEPQFINALSNFYFQTKKYAKALEQIQTGLQNAPYNTKYWESLSYIQEGLGNQTEAINAIEKALTYNPNLFSARERLRSLQNKEPILSYLKNENAYQEVSSALAKTSEADDNYEFIFDDRSYIIFPQGASMEYNSVAIKMLTEAGVDNYKESSIGYSSNRQSLTIETAEVIKKNGEKVQAERNRNELVFPSLEVGDAIFIEYRMENYTGGKLSKEFTREHIFNSFVPTNRSRFRLFTSADNSLLIEKVNFEKEPKEYIVDDFKCYEWEIENPEKCKEESYMPSLYEVGMGLHISSMDSWRTISEWYRDLALPMAKVDYNLEQVYNEIFEGKSFKDDYEKAEAIYDYISENIRYSSVSFRQSNFVPQKPMVTISTQLGDCKDVSTLYHTLAKKAGIDTHLVLVSTRDNGENRLKVPSIGFNHCIVRIDIDDKKIFQELTDNKLPFGSMPDIIVNAQALVIPNSATDEEGENLINIPNEKLVQDQLNRKSTVTINEAEEVHINTHLQIAGDLTSDYRHHLSNKTEEQTKEAVEDIFAKYFEGNFQLESYEFIELEGRGEEFGLKGEFLVENEVKSIGGLKAFQPPLFEEIFTLDPFPDEERVHPLLYWSYESENVYETETVVELPENAVLIELPQSFELSESFIQYSLNVEKLSDTSLKITRKVNIDNQAFAPEMYETFRETIKKIVKAEDIYVAYKL